MIRALANRKIVSDETAGKVVSGTMLTIGTLVMILGIRRLPEMDLTEAQVVFGALSIMTFGGICVLLAMVMGPAFKAR